MKCKARNWMACYWKAVPETRLQNAIIFRLPRRLKDNDEIEISGKLIPNPERLFLNLKAAARFPSYRRITCQLEIDFSSQKIIFRIKENGKEKIHELDRSPSDLFPDSEFKFTIKVGMDGSQTLGIFIGESYLDCWDEIYNLKYITFLTLSNNIKKVEELKFIYA